VEELSDGGKAERGWCPVRWVAWNNCRVVEGSRGEPEMVPCALGQAWKNCWVTKEKRNPQSRKGDSKAGEETQSDEGGPGCARLRAEVVVEAAGMVVVEAAGMVVRGGGGGGGDGGAKERKKQSGAGGWMAVARGQGVKAAAAPEMAHVARSLGDCTLALRI